MIHTLINLLGSFYESNDLSRTETIARSIHTAIPDDQVSLKFLGIVYFRTGRVKDAIRVFDQVECRQDAALVAEAQRPPAGSPGVDSAVLACSLEARRRVPYLAQAWQDLGKALQKLRPFDSAQQAAGGALPAMG